MAKIRITENTFSPDQEHWPAGEIAEVTKAQAAAYIRAGKAVPYNEPAPAPENREAEIKTSKREKPAAKKKPAAKRRAAKK